MPIHPCIHFRSGPAGRRPALVDGPDVWEVIRVVRNVEATGERAVEEAAQWLGLGRDRVEAALRYCAEYGPEIDDWIARVDEDAEGAHDGGAPVGGGKAPTPQEIHMDESSPEPDREIQPSPAETDAEALLLANLRQRAAELAGLLESCSDHWGFEDPVYRFYHQSFKAYYLQGKTREIVQVLGELAPERPLHRWFLEILEQGTGKEFEPEHNSDWIGVTRPILEAFFHARYFLEMAVRYADLKAPPNPLPSGYAALLELYGLR